MESGIHCRYKWGENSIFKNYKYYEIKTKDKNIRKKYFLNESKAFSKNNDNKNKRKEEHDKKINAIKITLENLN